MSSSGPRLIEMTGVDKRFGNTLALRGVDLSIGAGQCLGLVGRNGAGKSTVVSILSGLVAPDAGSVRMGGAPAPRVGDVARWREWIATVFQHSMVVPGLSVAENVFLGETRRYVSWRDLRARTRDIMRDWGYDIRGRGAVPEPDGGAAPDRRDRAGTCARCQVRAAGRADGSARTRRSPAIVRSGAAARRRRRRGLVYLPSPGRGLRDLPGRGGAARWEAGADRAGRRASRRTT